MDSLRRALLRTLIYSLLVLSYYVGIIPWLDLSDPSVRALALHRRSLPRGGVLKPPVRASQRPRLPGASVPSKDTKPCAFVFVLWSDDFVLPALVSIRSLRLYGTSHDIVVLVTSTGKFQVGQEGIDALEMLGARITRIKDVHSILGLSREGSSEINNSKGEYVSSMFLKLEAWKLTMYKRVLLVDADTVANTNVDTLLLAADCADVDLCTSGAHTTSVATSHVAQEVGPRNYFNGGFLHLKPSMEMFKKLVGYARSTPYLSKWAYEQDFLNLMVHKGVLSHRQIRPVGHYNKFPATKWIHFTSGKPWSWRSYPVHVPWTPRRKYWGIVRSWQWINIRYTLPGAFSLMTPTALWSIGLPVSVLSFVLLHRLPSFTSNSYNVLRANVLIHASNGPDASPHGLLRIILLTCVAVLWILSIGAPRLMYDTGILLQDRLSPSTAWITLALNSVALSAVVRPDSCTPFNCLALLCFMLALVCVVAVLELLHISTSPWGLPWIFCSTLLAVDKISNGSNFLQDAFARIHMWSGMTLREKTVASTPGMYKYT